MLYNAGELSSADSVTFPESLRYKTLTSHRPVYGGGGIMPDFFVPIDTSFLSDYHNKLINRGILNFFTLNYVDDNRSELFNKYPDIETFLNNFQVDEDMLADLISYAAKEDVPLNEEEFGISKERIRLIVKAFLARDLWDTSGFYEVLNTSSPSVLKAREVLESLEIYQALLQDKEGT